MYILTFDIEEWFHILDNSHTEDYSLWSKRESRVERTTYKILELLKEYGITASFFALGWVADRHRQLIKDIWAAGHEVGTHSHAHRLVYTQSREIFRDDLKRAIEAVSNITGSPVRFYRAPGFSIKSSEVWVFEELAKAGIDIDCSIFPSRRGHGGLSRFPMDRPCIIQSGNFKIKELPINILKIPFLNMGITFSGGGYFRLLPFGFVKRFFIGNSDYVMAYFHPRDFDSGQPRFKELSLLRQFKSYYGIESAFDKLKRLLGTFKFVDIATFAQMENWDKVPVISVDKGRTIWKS